MASRTLRQRKLAKALRDARNSAGLTAAELARRVRMQAGTISKIENLKQTIVARTVQSILSACGVGAPLMDTLMRIADESEAMHWWVAYGDTVPDWFRDYVDLESDAIEIWTYCSELVDGLLQTEEYADAIMRMNKTMTPGQRQDAVDLRKARQAQLSRENPPRLHIILNEAVVRRPVGGWPVMRAQLKRLAELSRRPNITLQVILFESGEHESMLSGQTLLRFPGDFADMDCVYHEHLTGALWQERPSDLAAYTSTFEKVAKRSLSPEKTTALLDSLGGETCDGIEGSSDGETRPMEDKQL